MSDLVVAAQRGPVSKYQSYTEYKDSEITWLGEIPSHWLTSKLRYMFTFGKGLSITKENLRDEGIPCVNYGEVHSKYGFEVDPTKHLLKRVEEDYLKTSSSSMLNVGDFVFADTSEDIDGSGNFTQLTSDIVTFAGYHTIIVRPIDKDSHRYFAYLFDSKEFRTSIRHAVKGVKVFSITQAILRGADIWLPSQDERHRIAAFLDYETTRIDRLIAQQKRLIELLKEKRQAVISHAVTKGLNPDAPMKDSCVEWLGQVPEHWVTHALKYAASSCKKSFTDGDWIETPYISDEGVRLLQTGNIGIGHFKEQGFRYISEHSFKTLKCTEVKPNDVLICRLDGPVGRSCLAPHLDIKMITSVDNAILKPSDDFDAEFLVYLTNSLGWLEWIQDICRVGGGFRLRISRTMLGEQIIPVPPIDEQKAIAKELNLLSEYTDLCIQKCTEAIALLVERRSALISAAVTGKIDLRGWTPPADEVAA